MSEFKAKAKSTFKTLRVFINIILLLITVIVIIQNSGTITINFLWTQLDISIALLVFLTGSVGSAITLFFLLFKK